ncbi:GIY-YIG nuclease family protein [Aliivibrio fischeri]|uniref:GIY-YIG nuclease family protein n=1 Tax=Aliivibrio fischeri TaxID=668 RepID=UPI0012D92C3D|nr:GIY-YIG nuclease family protein [Aliivibrio fischeri]MUK26589.1 hypothetical protein [Aliivibrio fischeri]MUK33301.1 hypothetical protein [Aliivibrio fischeri]
MFKLPDNLTEIAKKAHELNSHNQSQSIVVYYIAIDKHEFNLDKGYIGVTSNFTRRKSQHFNALVAGDHTNHKLQDYYDKHKESVKMFIYKSFPLSQENSAYQLEEYLRPKENIGLNIAVGGKKNYDNIFKAKKYTQTAYVSSKKENFYSTLINWFKNIDKVVATSAEQSLKKSEIRQKEQQQHLDQWAREQEYKLNLKINEHLNRPKLTKEQMKAIDSWKNER